MGRDAERHQLCLSAHHGRSDDGRFYQSVEALQCDRRRAHIAIETNAAIGVIAMKPASNNV
jgi:hypothetical protein